ncbi:MAG: hypothetical protein ACPGQV_22680 [Alphaproteobacteria bacterium]
MKKNQNFPALASVGLIFGLVCFSALPDRAQAQTASERIKLLEATLKDLLKRDEEKDRLMKRMAAEIKSLGGATVSKTPQEAGYDQTNKKKSIFAQKVGDTTIRLNAIGINVAAVAGYSSEVNATSRALQGGGHDPDGTGFTLQTADFSMTGSADGYFDTEFHSAFFIDHTGTSQVEIEEAFLRTNSLPYGLEVEAGQQFLEFGAFNPLHVHDWDFIDQPVILTRMFGGDGIRQTGIRVGWQLSGTPFGFHGGAYNPNGETMKSFLAADETIGGRTFKNQEISGLSDLVYLARLETHGKLGRKSHFDFGISALTGPNATGNDASTFILGADLRLERKLSGDRTLLWQSEALYRRYDLDVAADAGLPSAEVKDYGFYTQAIYGFAPKFSAGLRYEFASGNGDGVTLRDADNDRSNRHRLSPMLRWAFSPLGDLRLQYNYDNMDSLSSATNEANAHAVWLGLRFGFGAGGEFWSEGNQHAH